MHSSILTSICCIDYGAKHSGIALSTNNISYPYKTIPTALQYFTKLALNYQITLFVIGLPIMSNGSEQTQCKKIRTFCNKQLSTLHIPIDFICEAYSTKIVSNLYPNQKITDHLVAYYLLTKYLQLKNTEINTDIDIYSNS